MVPHETRTLAEGHAVQVDEADRVLLHVSDDAPHTGHGADYHPNQDRQATDHKFHRLEKGNHHGRFTNRPTMGKAHITGAQHGLEDDT